MKNQNALPKGHLEGECFVEDKGGLCTDCNAWLEQIEAISGNQNVEVLS